MAQFSRGDLWSEGAWKTDSSHPSEVQVVSLAKHPQLQQQEPGALTKLSSTLPGSCTTELYKQVRCRHLGV